MADEDTKKVSSNPAPPTDDIDEDWGSSGTAAPAPGKAEASSKEDAKKESSTKSSAPPKKASPRDEDEEDDDEDEDEEDDDDDDDEDEDEEDDDDDRRDAKSRRKGAASAASSSFDDLIPDWLPWATLGGLLLLGFLGGIGAVPIDCNLKPAVASATAEATPSAAPATAATTARPSMSARARPQMPDDGEKVAASHLLVSYKGALRAQPSVTRTKEEAERRAKEALAKAKKGQEFEKLVAEYSDEPMAAQRGGKLGKFSRGNMVKEFSDAAFALKVGQLSDIVETKFGFHVIKRTE